VKNDDLKNLLEVFLTVQISKELPRQGFLYSGFKRSEADSVAAHSYSVTVFAYLLAIELKENGFDIDPDRALKIALVHDLGETITGDIGTYAKDLARGVFDSVENKAFSLLTRNLSKKDEMKILFEEYQKLDSVEAQIVKLSDLLDAFTQGANTSNAVIEDIISTVILTAKKKIKSVELRKIFLDSVRLIGKRKVTPYKGHIATKE